MLKRNEQLALNIPSSEPEYSPESYIVSDSNRAAYEYIMQWPWQSRGVILVGAGGSGKKHLAHCWKETSGASFLEADNLNIDMDGLLGQHQNIIIDLNSVVDDPILMRVYDHVEKHGKSILILTEKAITGDSRTADLNSRFNSWQMIELPLPDDLLLETLLYKAFSSKQLDVSADVVQYLMPRISRDAHSVRKIADAIDTESMSEKRNITVPFVKKVLDKISSLDLLEE